MTEEEWQSGHDGRQMMEYISNPKRPRKYRLFNCACCQHLRAWFFDPRLDDCLQRAEKYANGGLSDQTFAKWNEVARLILRESFARTRAHQTACYAVLACCTTRQAWVHPKWDPWRLIIASETGSDDALTEDGMHFALCYLRDIFGNPFRPVAFSPSWRTSTAIGVAQTMYDSREFNAMPILADALQDAGCEDEGILAHCRDENGIHVRGCWVVDLVLNKS